MKRKLIAGILAGTMILSLAGCGNTSSPASALDENKTAASEDTTASSENSTAAKETGSASETGGTTIQFWNSFTGTDGDVLRDLVEIYNKTNEKGNTVEMDIMPTASLEEKLPAAIASKTAPALVIKGNFDVATYGDNNIFQSADDFFDATGTDKDDFSTASLEALQYNGSQLMIPMQVHSTFLFWNKDLFEAAGLDPEAAPTTWDEVAEYAAKITDNSKKIYGVGLPVSGAPCYFDAMFKSNGGDVVSEDGKSSILDSPENLKTLQYIQDLVTAGYAPKGATGADTDNLMLAGQLGIYCSGPWLVSGLKENDINFGVTAMPSGTKEAAGVIEVQGFGVTSTCSEEEKAAAYDFIAFWNTTETCKAWSLRNGFPPYLQSVAKDKEVQADPIVNALSSISEFGYSFAPGVKAANQINSEVLFPLIENISSGNDCQTELSNASEKVNELLSAN
ncbi:ABC transporter substrate-binding protein [Konateibacter massiliensis]|uniref:ABC transporter substrate-binding protein n=1 Tax=Konateibacter massiliensis TaxID=2002841 RepID=UPI000C14FF62|nr:ABC transporter substrate-binding protein [Konateibacter massiliensis]